MLLESVFGSQLFGSQDRGLLTRLGNDEQISTSLSASERSAGQSCGST